MKAGVSCSSRLSVTWAQHVARHLSCLLLGSAALYMRLQERRASFHLTLTVQLQQGSVRVASITSVRPFCHLVAVPAVPHSIALRTTAAYRRQDMTQSCLLWWQLCAVQMSWALATAYTLCSHRPVTSVCTFESCGTDAVLSRARQVTVTSVHWGPTTKGRTWC